MNRLAQIAGKIVADLEKQEAKKLFHSSMVKSIVDEAMSEFGKGEEAFRWIMDKLEDSQKRRAISEGTMRELSEMIYYELGL